MSLTPADLDGLRRLIALKTSESETGAKDKNSEDDKRVGKTAGQGLLYADRKCFDSLSATSQDSIKCLPSTSSWIELGFFS
jgi:hypothetical protein